MGRANVITSVKDMPNCCRSCVFLEDDYNEFCDRNAFFCRLCIILPAKKKSCEKRRK